MCDILQHTVCQTWRGVQMQWVVTKDELSKGLM